MAEVSLWNRSGIADYWRGWEGQIVDGLLPLRQYLGGSADRAVFLTEYRAANSNRAVVKVVLAGGDRARMLLDRWRDAAEVAHPLLVRLFACGSGSLEGIEFVYAVMEYAEEVLAGVLEARHLTATEAGDMIEPAVEALVFLHSRGLVHGHLSPANILAVEDQLKLSSDSICRWETSGEILRGRDSWDAPETAATRVSPASDVWSLGAVIAAAVTQRPVLSDAVPEPFYEIVSHSLRENPRERWTASQILAYLGTPVTARHGPAPRFHWRFSTAALLVVVAMAVLALAWFWSRSRMPAAPVAANPEQPAAVAPPQPRPSAMPSSSSVPASVPSPPPALEAGQRTERAPVQREERPEAHDGAAVVWRPLPDIPRRARETIHGTVRVNIRVAVDKSGHVVNAGVVPPEKSRYLANLTLDAARHWRFSPGRRQEWLLRFELLRDGTKVFPERMD